MCTISTVVPDGLKISQRSRDWWTHCAEVVYGPLCTEEVGLSSKLTWSKQRCVPRIGHSDFGNNWSRYLATLRRRCPCKRLQSRINHVRPQALTVEHDPDPLRWHNFAEYDWVWILYPFKGRCLVMKWNVKAIFRNEQSQCHEMCLASHAGS